MVDKRTCGGCEWLIEATAMSCGAPFACRHQDWQPPTQVFVRRPFDSTRPAGYRTPEDRLQDIEKRLDGLERRDA